MKRSYDGYEVLLLVRMNHLQEKRTVSCAWTKQRRQRADLWKGLSTSCSGNFLATFFVSRNFWHSEQFRKLSCSNPEISKQLLELKLTFRPCFTIFQQTMYKFPVKKEPNPSPWGRSCAQDKSSRAARSAVFKENSKWWTKIHTRLSEEHHSKILLAHCIFWF